MVLYGLSSILIFLVINPCVFYPDVFYRARVASDWFSADTMVVQRLRNKFWFKACTRRDLCTWRGLKNVLECIWMQAYASLKSKLSPYRLLPLRQRYFMTRENRLRFRYVLGCLTIGLIGAFSVIGAPATSAILSAADEFKTAVAEKVEQQEIKTEFAEVNPVVSSGIRKASLAIKKPAKPRYRELEVKSGDTVAGLLQEAGLSGSEAYQAVKALGKYYDVRKVRSGQKIGVHFKPAVGGALEFSKMAMKLDPVKEVSIQRMGPEDFKAELSEKELFPRVYARKAEIQTSVYGSAARASIPSSVIANMIRIYSWNIDFQRDIRSGDKIEVLYEAFETEDGEFARYGNVLYANLSVGGKDHPIYRFEMNDGDVDYFEPDGISIRKTLMKTPVDGARISSGFGMRKHPILGYNKMHKGMDFAAPTGTPIYAAGDGVIEEAGRKGAYGKYIRVRHNSKLKTAYAHLHRIKVKPGTRVKQGEVIGTVGNTGRSTGPHLHYEVILNGKQVNPRSVNLPTGEQLKGKELSRFKAMAANVYKEYVNMSEGLKFAFRTSKADSDT